MKPYLIDVGKKFDWRDEWKDMPEFVQEDLFPEKSIELYFKNEKDVQEFAKLVNQKITKYTQYIWYPYMPKNVFENKRYVTKEIVNPKYPIYIISKGRWEFGYRLTSRVFEKMKIPYHIVVEPQEYEQYVSVIDKEKILVLPFSNLGQGSIPARNWVWEHSISIGAKRHWVIDDNIRGFARYNKNEVIKVTSGTIFKCAENFVDRYENVAIAGFQYNFFTHKRTIFDPAFFLNTRIYSCILIQNDIPYRWRGKYNEDTDLSLRVLKDGWCTLLFYAFVQFKTKTMLMKGGNTDNVYVDGDNRLKFAQSLQKQHPDVVRVTKKWGRCHHQVDYSSFKKNRLIKKKGLLILDRINNYGMELVNIGKTQ